MNTLPRISEKIFPNFLKGNGEMRKLIRSKDWSKTSLGTVHTWPAGLRTSVRICLDSPSPCLILYGNDFINIYNDFFSELLHDIEPPLGLPGTVAYKEKLPDLTSILERTLEHNGTAFPGNQLLNFKGDRSSKKQTFKVSASSIYDEGEDPAGIFFVFTEIKPAAAPLMHEADKLQHTLDSARLGTYELDMLRGEIVFSPRLSEIFGFDPSKKMTYEDLKKAIHPEDTGIRMEAHARSKETGFLFYEARVLWPDQSVHWVRVNGKLTFNDNGNALYSYGTAMDITDYKIAEKVLKASEQELRLIADAIPHMVWVLEPDGTISYINKQWADWTGLTLKEINLGKWQDLFHPEDLQHVKSGWAESMQLGKLFTREYRIRKEKGGYSWFMGKTIPMRNSEGKIMKWIGTSTNIDDQKKVQDALKKSEEQFRQLADSMPQIVWTATPDGFLDYYNKKWYEFTGFTEGADPDMSREKILHPDDVKICTETWNHSVKTGKPSRIEYRFRNRRKPGSYCWYLGRALPIFDKEGKIVKWYGTCTDINDQKEIEALLKDSEEHFRQMANAVPQQVWTATAEGGLDYVNQRIVNYFGKSFSEMVAAGRFEGIHRDDVANVLDSWQHSIRSVEPFEVEFRLKDRNNNYRWHLARATPYLNKHNEVKWFGTNTDIEEQKYGEQKKDEFISIASHELKTPVTSLKGIAFILNELLQENDLEQVPQLLKAMDNQLNKLSKLVTDLLDVRKIGGQHLQLDKEDFYFNELVKETVEGIQHMSPRHHLVIESIPEVVFNGDKERLGQVITNLLTNAVKYSPDSNKVIIKYEATNDHIVFSVQDFGIGIARENITKLFNRFYRVHNSLRFGGLGLGLYISGNIIKAHGGNFWIESKMNEGSTFYFLLPRRSEPRKIKVQTDNKSYYIDENVQVNFDKENQWIQANWTGFQNYESVQRGGLIIHDFLKTNECTKVLNDNSNVKGSWSDVVEWVGKVLFPQLQNAGLQHLAWVYSPSTFSQLAAEKSVNMMSGNITTQFFESKAEASSWLKQF